MISFRHALGLLWCGVTFIWLIAPPCLHLWRSRRLRHWGRSPLDGRARSGLQGRIVLVLVIIIWELAALWDSWIVLYGAAFAVCAFLLIKELCWRFSGKSRDVARFPERNDVLVQKEAEGAASLGPCSEEAEAALTDEAMLSLWYGGLNGIYARKFRGAGRWLAQICGHTPKEFLRSWASDNPYLRASAYYIKAVLSLLSMIVVILLFAGRDIMVFADFWDENVVGYDWIDLVFHFVSYLAVMGPFFLYFFCFPGKKWRMHYRTLSRALEEGRDPDLSDRARIGEMRRTILGWAWNSGYVRYDREKGWRLNAPSKGTKGGRLIE